MKEKTLSELSQQSAEMAHILGQQEMQIRIAELVDGWHYKKGGYGELAHQIRSMPLSDYPLPNPPPIGDDMKRVDIFETINKERKRQDEKWGKLESREHRTHFSWLAVLIEEVGEVAQALLKWIDQGARDMTDVVDELIHCAAVIVSWLEDRF